MMMMMMTWCTFAYHILSNFHSFVTLYFAPVAPKGIPCANANTSLNKSQA